MKNLKLGLKSVFKDSFLLDALHYVLVQRLTILLDVCIKALFRLLVNSFLNLEHHLVWLFQLSFLKAQLT